jgi:3'-phosphoadenosine 5'-phosphosulfate sulfotransferase (PAPS reductase)/FAD synthetase
MNSIVSTETKISMVNIMPAIDERTMAHNAKIEVAKDRVKKVFDSGKCIVLATSYGKDSSVLGNVVLTAALEYMKDTGSHPHVRFVNSNTKLENPMMDFFAKSESKKVEAFSKIHGLNVQADIVSPSLSNNYLINIIGGRTIATLSDNDAKCSQMMKVDPINRHKKRVFKEFGAKNVVTALGKRIDESPERGRGMIETGEATGEVITSKNKELIFSPIADFTLGDIATYIGRVGTDSPSRKIPCYSDFQDLLKVYRDANGGDCLINIYASGRASKSACGARTGCHICLRVADDKSMINMLEEPENQYMRPLNVFRNFLAATHYDPDRRNWIARTLNKDGTVNIAPNAYSPAHTEDLLRYALTIDANEIRAAARDGVKPRFQLLSLEDVIAIEVLWSRYGYHLSAAALTIFDEVHHRGIRYDTPTDVKPFSNQELKKKLTTKKVPFADKDFYSMFSGLRDVYSAQADCEDTVTKNGISYSNVNTGIEFEIDEEGTELFYCFEFENFLAKYSKPGWNPTQVVHYFSGLGTLTLNKGGHSRLEKMLRMANQIHRHGIRDILNNPEALIEKLSQHTAFIHPNDRVCEEESVVVDVLPIALVEDSGEEFVLAAENLEKHIVSRIKNKGKKTPNKLDAGVDSSQFDFFSIENEVSVKAALIERPKLSVIPSKAKTNDIDAEIRELLKSLTKRDSSKSAEGQNKTLLSRVRI